jgi:hypothetical protein
MSWSALPVTEIFIGLIQWILESEMVALMHICDQIDGFVDNPNIV